MRRPGSRTGLALSGSLVGFLLLGGAFACSSGPGQEVGRAPEAAPVKRPALEQIPVDLDFVARLDLGRLRGALPPGAVDELSRLMTAQGEPSERLLTQALTRTETLWIGVRPSFTPAAWDNVLVLEGDFSSISDADLHAAFGPARDLGAGFFAREALNAPRRTSPARLYTYLEEQWLIASRAEVSALERVIEDHRYERRTKLSARGLFSFDMRLDRLAAELESEAPKAARFLEAAESLQANVELRGRDLGISARLRFIDEEQAQSAARALGVFTRLLLGQEQVEVLELRIEPAAQDVTIEFRVPPELVARVF